MAQHRQSGHLYSNGGSSDHSHVSIGIRTSNSQLQQKPGRVRKWGRSDKARFASGFSFSSVSVVLCLVLLVTVLTYYYLSIDSKEMNEDRVEDDDDARNESDFLTNVSRMDSFKVHGFGKGSVVHGRDSRYWDRDDRRRDEDYDEDDVDHSGEDRKGHSTDEVTGEKKVEIGRRKMYRDALSKGLDRRGVGLYNEDGRKELKKYEAEYEASLKTGAHLGEDGVGDQIRNDDDSREQNVVDIDEYDDGIGLLDIHGDEYGNSEHDMGNPRNEDGTESSKFVHGGRKDHKTAKDIKETTKNSIEKRSLSKSQILDNVDTNFRSAGGVSASKSRSDSKKKTKRRKFSGSCEMKFLNITQLVEPLESGKFARFSLQYVDKEENPNNQKQWEPRFAGHQSLQEREDSFLAHDKKIHCGFVKGPEGSPSTGFDLTEDDENYLHSCHIAVISCIFGNSDRLRSPVSKMVSRLSRKNVCFVMFVDELTLGTLSSENQMLDREGFIGLWKIVVVKNLPYTDMRRVGKVPKLLPHRLFPSARYSIWLDSKLRFQVDPMLVLEYFLWRKGYEYAISNHYDRHCVWEEVAQNKRLNKYNHTVIDEQFAFYQADGLKRFNASDPKKILPSNVPEGSLIVRAHTPMSNLFSCLWFNEVERFTPRDQLSFTYTYQKLRRMNPGKPFRLNMFKDCERRAIAKLFRHRSEEKRNIIHQESAE